MSASNPNHSPVIFGFQATALSDAEMAFFREVQPWGLILFARNVETRAQLRALTNQIRNLFDDPHYPILIDQEGGRVMRVRPPLVRDYPAAARYGQIYASDKAAGQEAARLGAALLAADLYELGITINCAPCLDLSFADASDVIGNRSFGADVQTVVALGQAFIAGLEAGGIVPVVKHLPGHGRAMSDSHHTLPVIDTPYSALEASDFAAFRAVDAPIGMTGHLLFTDIDAAQVSTFSARVVARVIRGTIGFDGLLMSDDISMQALKGDFTKRANLALNAGCDVILHCNGDMDEMQAIAKSLPERPQSACLARMEAVSALLAARQCRVDADMQQKWNSLCAAHNF